MMWIVIVYGSVILHLEALDFCIINASVQLNDKYFTHQILPPIFLDDRVCFSGRKF